MQPDEVSPLCSQLLIFRRFKKNTHTNFGVKMVLESLVWLTNSAQDIKLTMILNNKFSHWTTEPLKKVSCLVSSNQQGEICFSGGLILSWCSGDVTCVICMNLYFYLNLRRGTMLDYFECYFLQNSQIPFCWTAVIFTSTNIRLDSQEHLGNQWNHVLFQFLWNIRMIRSVCPVI